MDEDEEMILFNHRVESEESGVVEEGKGTELEPLNPPVPTETVISKYSPVVTDSAGLKFEGS